MIQDVKALPVSFYFSPDGTTSFFIPKYQREYVWGGKNWDALFNDLEESPSGHFLGSIICVNTQQDGMAGVLTSSGNLTLSCYNPKLGTMGFLKKPDRKNDQGDFIGYHNGLYPNADLASRDDWNEVAITARIDKMLKEVMSILSLQEEQ